MTLEKYNQMTPEEQLEARKNLVEEKEVKRVNLDGHRAKIYGYSSPEASVEYYGGRVPFRFLFSWEKVFASIINEADDGSCIELQSVDGQRWDSVEDLPITNILKTGEFPLHRAKSILATEIHTLTGIAVKDIYFSFEKSGEVKMHVKFKEEG